MRAAQLSGLALLVLACRTTSPELLPIIGEEDRIGAWLGAARLEAEGRVGVRAVGRARLYGPRGSSRVRQVIIAQRPGRLRLESLNFLGQTASLLVTDGESYAFFDGERVQRGGVFPNLLRETLGLDLEPSEAVALLVAAPSFPRGPPRAVLGRGLERFVLFDGKQLGFGGDGRLRSVEAFDSHGQLRWLAEYDTWREIEGGHYPFAIVLSFPHTSLRAEIELHEVEMNPVLDIALFRLGPEVGE